MNHDDPESPSFLTDSIDLGSPWTDTHDFNRAHAVHPVKVRIGLHTGEAIRRADKALVSTVSVVEARMVAHVRRGQRAVVLLDDFLSVRPRTSQVN